MPTYVKILHYLTITDGQYLKIINTNHTFMDGCRFKFHAPLTLSRKAIRGAQGWIGISGNRELSPTYLYQVSYSLLSFTIIIYLYCYLYVRFRQSYHLREYITDVQILHLVPLAVSLFQHMHAIRAFIRFPVVHDVGYQIVGSIFVCCFHFRREYVSEVHVP